MSLLKSGVCLPPGVNAGWKVLGGVEVMTLPFISFNEEFNFNAFYQALSRHQSFLMRRKQGSETVERTLGKSKEIPMRFTGTGVIV